MVSCCLMSALVLYRCRRRCRSISGQHSVNPRVCVRQVIKLIHLQPVREILGTCGWRSGMFSILASSSISSRHSLRYAFLLSTSVNDSSVVLPLSLVSLVSHVSPISHASMSCELLRFISVGNSSVMSDRTCSNEKLVDTVGDMRVDLTHSNHHVVARFLVRGIVD